MVIYTFVQIGFPSKNVLVGKWNLYIGVNEKYEQSVLFFVDLYYIWRPIPPVYRRKQERYLDECSIISIENYDKLMDLKFTLNNTKTNIQFSMEYSTEQLPFYGHFDYLKKQQPNRNRHITQTNRLTTVYPVQLMAF